MGERFSELSVEWRGVAVNRTNSVLKGCRVLRDEDHKSPLAWSLSMEASSQGRDRGEKKVGVKGRQASSPHR